MKGTTTLQLIDPKTKEVLKEIKHDNYITDLYKDFYTKLQTYHTTNIGQGLNLKFEDFAQGVILFEDTMPTSGCIYPRRTDVATGYAYDLYSGDDVKRGSLNELESGPITGGYRKVWDFGTGIAIGDIKALSLTTGGGGSHDLNTVKDNVGDGNAFAYQTGVTGYSDYTACYACCDISDDYLLYTYKYESAHNFDYSNFWIVKFNGADLRYDTNLKIYGGEGYDSENITRMNQDDFDIQDVPTDYTRSSVPCIDNDYLYVLHYKAGTGFKIHRYSLATGVYVDELTYNFTYTAAPEKFKVTSTDIVWANGNDIYWADKATLTEKSVLNVTNYSIRALCMSKKYSDTIVTFSDSGASYNGFKWPVRYVDMANEEAWGIGSLTSSSYVNNGVYSSLGRLSSIFVDEPYFLFGRFCHNGAVENRVSLGWITGMPGNGLATINNLPSTVSKATDQVLKVIYDITW